MIKEIFKSWLHLPRPDYRTSWGKDFHCYAPTGQVYQVKSNKVQWVPVTPVHFGTLATRPAPGTVPPGALAIYTDQTYTSILNAAGTAWIDSSSGGGASDLLYTGALSGLAAAGAGNQWKRAIITDWRNVVLLSDGTRWTPAGNHAVLDKLAAPFVQGAAPGATETLARTVAIPAIFMPVGTCLVFSAGWEHQSGTTDTATFNLKVNGTLIASDVAAANKRNNSADFRYLVTAATTLAKAGPGAGNGSWGDDSGTLRSSATINDVTASGVNTFTAHLQMTTGTSDLANLNWFTVEAIY